VESRCAIVVAICISDGGIPRLPISPAKVTFHGIEGDGHRYESHFQKSRGLTIFPEEGFAAFENGVFQAGCVGENITTLGIDYRTLSVGCCLQLGEVEIVLSKIWKPCHAFCSDKAKPVPNHLGVTGFFAEVLKEGTLQPGCKIHVDIQTKPSQV